MRYYISRFGPLFWALSLALLIAFPAPLLAQGTTGTITGLITDTSNVALQGASVTAGGKTTTTDTSGHYTLASVAAGSQILTASQLFYANASTTVNVVKRTTLTAPTLKLSPNWGSIAGVVKNAATSNAISGATVSISGANLTATTDTGGNYSFAKAPSGSQTLTVSASGYQSAAQATSVVSASTSTVNFSLNATVVSGATIVNVDAQTNRHTINPNIYGIAYGTPTVLSDLNVLLNRQGGNNTTRYNWQINADNRANDYYYESIADPSAVAGERGDTFISNSKSVGAQSMLTLPLIDWVAKLGPNRNKLASFSVAKYGAQTSTDPYFPDAGNGIKASGGNVTGNDPNDANVPNSVALQQGWVQHLVNQWGPASTGGLRYYLLDNEPSIWFGTHRDVAPTGVTMDAMKTKMINYASMIKSVDPSALVVGPEEWGWDGFRFSGYDQQYSAAHNYTSYPDRASHNNMDYVPYLLDQMHQYEVTNGKRLLDIFSLHFYPQGGEFGNDTSANMQTLRNRSTRGLWDPNYVNESWIGTQVQLIPRMKNWVSAYYPGLPIALTEYNWGAEGHINGATTQADIYGIFGREGLDMATRWTYPDPSTPTYKAMKLYRNYDGNKSTFGDTSVSTTTANPDNLSAFSAVRTSDGALTVMVISKVLSGTTPVTVNLANFSAAGSAQVWQLTSANAITQLANVAAATSVTLTVPAQSITLVVIPPAPTNTALYQIDSGGGPVGTFISDSYFSGGVTASTNAAINLAGVANAAPMGVYQSLRSASSIHSNLSYSFPGLNAGATYTVRLHFADYWVSVAGGRTFNVTINSAPVLTNFDIFAAAGAINKAVNRNCTGVADSSGNLFIDFVGVNGPALVSGIEVIGAGSVPAPPAPTNLAASAGNAQVNLTWNTSPGAASYNVKRSLTGGSGYTTVATGVTTTSYTNTGLANGTTYYYFVTAVNATGESANSNQASATPTASQSALYQIDSGGGPVGTFIADNYFSGGEVNATTATIDLTGVANAAPQGVYQSLRSTWGFSYNLPGLTAGATYTVRLHFVDYWVSVVGGRTFNVTINNTAALTNFDVFAAAGALNRAVVRDCTGIADANGNLLINFTGVNGPALVSGIEILGSGSLPIPTAPGSLTASSGNTQINLTWNASSGAASYNVKRSLTTSGPYSTIAAGVTTTSYTNIGLTNGTTYYYVVTAVNAAGESANSNQASATPAVQTAVYQINSGGGALGAFSADNFFSGGVTASTTSPIDLAGVVNAAPQGVYQSLRSASSVHAGLSYTLSSLTAGATYTVRLHFVDYWVSAAGARTFNVTINNTSALTNFDIFAAAGAINRAVTRDCTGATDSSGNLVINFVGVNGPALVSGIEILH